MTWASGSKIWKYNDSGIYATDNSGVYSEYSMLTPYGEETVAVNNASLLSYNDRNIEGPGRKISYRVRASTSDIYSKVVTVTCKPLLSWTDNNSPVGARYRVAVLNGTTYSQSVTTN